MKKLSIILMLFLGLSNLYGEGYLLPIEVFPRSIALGNAVVTSDGSSSLFADNPATITATIRRDLMFALDFGKDGLFVSTISFATPLFNKKIYLGYYQTFLVKNIPVVFPDFGTGFPFPTGFKGGTKGALGLAMKPLQNFSLGFALQFCVEVESSQDYSFEPFLMLGFEYYIPALRLKLGLSMANLRPVFEAMTSENDYLEQVKWGGDFLLLDNVFHQINVLFSLIKIRDTTLRAGFGVEYKLMKSWFFRLGWNSLDDFPRVGIGYKALSVIVGLKFDISFRYREETGGDLLFSFGADF